LIFADTRPQERYVYQCTPDMCEKLRVAQKTGDCYVLTDAELDEFSAEHEEAVAIRQNACIAVSDDISAYKIDEVFVYI
jgi:hypothetical protein